MIAWATLLGSPATTWAQQATINPSPSASIAQPVAQGQRTALEVSLIEEALAFHDLQVDPHPEGKRIERIEIYGARVFDDRDPIPNFLNVFHVKTRDFMIRQEVLLRVGQEWEIGRVLETERNLRELRQLSVANVIATRGSDEQHIVLLVVTKDVWSLRLNSDIKLGSGGLDTLLLNPTEENLAGLRATLGLLFILQRDRYFLGGNLAYPRLPGTRLSVDFSAGVYQNRYDGSPEGSYGYFQFELPQFSRHSRWAYGAEASFRFELTRQYTGGQLVQVQVPDETGREVDVPWLYESERMLARYWGLRSWGVDHKIDVEAGLALDHRRNRPHDMGNYSPIVVDNFATRWLPVSDTRIYPYLTLSAYETRYFRDSSIESLNMQEDFRLGYGVSTTLWATARTFGSTRDSVGVRNRLLYTVGLGDGFLRLRGSNRIVVANDGKDEGNVTAAARFVSPRGALGRLHLDSYLGVRYRDYLNVTPYGLGVNNRLRGYGPDAFYGKNIWVGNAEFRTKGVDILSAQVGLAVFYDVGGVDNHFNELKLRQSVGAGLRVVFPQAERTALRVDWGVPISGDVEPVPGALWVTFGQAFPMPVSLGGNDKESTRADEPFVD